MIVITKSSTTKELEGILELQKQNLKKDLTPEQIKEEGFVTVSHSLEVIHTYTDNSAVEWNVVVWDWRDFN
jgi:hypothetical protein